MTISEDHYREAERLAKVAEDYLRVSSASAEAAARIARLHLELALAARAVSLEKQ